ncbi:hypothetical protein K488DRAFT_89825 [Vararia minispora EC-137]|uniref:Uncharacterized protein n=1 Tax=Vararia minispora EC-137 TaxID=1314806 RepID=A0ACB8Q954_9AGAM|nr:hypothetical protein K488DRAFT_89825 [Vararia minispora EC-137]
MSIPVNPTNASDSGWQLGISRNLDVLGPFPIHAREQHFLSPSFPIDLRSPIDLRTRWPSSYADGGEVSWKQIKMLDNGNILVSYPDIRWSQLRATEGWAAVQHHSVVRVSLTVYPPSTDESSALLSQEPQLSVKLLQGSFFSLLPTESHPSRTMHIPQWYSGDVYATGALPSLLRLPVAPARDQPTSYDLYISGDYEIRLFGDPRSSGTETPTLNISLEVQLASSSEHVVHETTLDVLCDFVDGYAFGDAIGIGIRSTAGWWTVSGARLIRPIPGFSLNFLGDGISLFPGQARTVPLRISQERPIEDTDVLEIEIELENASLGKATRHTSLKVIHKQLCGKIGLITASYFFALSVPTAFVVKRSLEQTSSMDQPHAPLLALHGAGVDALSQPFWPDALPALERSWIVMPTGRTSWGFDWRGQSAEDAWSTVSALRKILASRSEWFGWRLPEDEKVVLIGHSNGGQGTWYFMSRWPDRVLAAVPAAAYIKAQAYVPLTQSRSSHFIDPMLRAVLEAAYTADDNDLFLSNAAHTPTLAIHGGEDDNVPVWHTREAVSVVKTWNRNADVTYMEDAGQGHWYPDIFRRARVQEFLKLHTASDRPDKALPRSFTLTAMYPSDGSSLFGWRIQAVRVIGRLARLTVESIDERVVVVTSNVRAFTVGQIRLPGCPQFQVDGQSVPFPGTMFFEYSHGLWKQTANNVSSRKHYRLSGILNSAGPLTIVVPDNATSAQLSSASRIAHGLQMFYKLDSEIVFESDHSMRTGNIIAIGTRSSAFVRRALGRYNGVFEFGDSIDGPRLQFRGESMNPEDGAIFLQAHPHTTSAAMLFIIADDDSALDRVTRLFPLRTGIATPDWLVIQPLVDSVGAAGVKSAGMFDEYWGYNEAMAWGH